MSFSLQFLVLFCLTTCYGTVTKLKILGRRNSGIFFEGETMTVRCTVTNAVKTPHIIWLMSGRRIIPDENRLINVTFNGTSALSILTLHKLNVAEYRGQYLRCKDHENDESSSNTDPLKIGRISVTKSSRQFLKYGNNETLTCSLSEGKPEDIDYLLWRKIPSEKVLQTVSNKAKLELHVEHINGNNAGYYECVFKASNGNFTLTKSVEIKVVPSINSKKQQKEIIYRIPNTVILTCDIQGHPLTILWKVNCNSNSSGSHIYFNHTLANENITLVINETNEESSRMLCCIGWNSAGKAKQFFSLKRPFDKNCGKNNGGKLRNGLDIIFFLILSHVML